MIPATSRLIRSLASGLEVAGARRVMRTAPSSPGETFDFITNFHYGAIEPHPMQVRSEMVSLLERLAANPPRTVVELGTARGGTLFLLTRVAADDATLVSVDMPGSGGYPGIYPRTHAPLLRSFARAQQTVHLIRADSQASSTAADIQSKLGGRSIDFLFIDADHEFEGVKRDFELYSPFVSPNGLIAFHDIVPGYPERVGGVTAFWAEVKESLPHEEIVEDWDQNGFGIGLLFNQPSG